MSKLGISSATKVDFNNVDKDDNYEKSMKSKNGIGPKINFI